MLVDVGARNLTGKDCQIALDEAGITVNKNTIPFETRSPFQASGVRLGTPAVTTRGMRELEMEKIAGLDCRGAEPYWRSGNGATHSQRSRFASVEIPAVCEAARSSRSC